MKNGATNPLSNSICVSSAYPTNQSTTSQIKNVSKKSNNISPPIDVGTTKCGAITKKSQPKVTAFNASVAGSNGSTTAATLKNSLNLTVNGKVNGKLVTTTTTPATNPKQTMNGYKSINGTTVNQYNKAGSGNISSSNSNSTSNINNNNNNINNTNNNNNSSNHNGNANTTNNNVNNNNETKSTLLSSDSFKRRLGTYPLSPYKNPEFLKCEYDLARSQVINSRSRSACSGEKNNNYNNHNQNHNLNHNNNLNDNSSHNSKCNSNSELNYHPKTNGFASQSLTSSPVAKDTNKITIFGVNTASASVSNTNGTVNTINLAVKSSSIPSNTAEHIQSEKNQSNETMMNANCIQHATVDHLDDIKFIDSDDSEHRRHSPANATAAAAAAAATIGTTMNVATLKEFFNDGLAINGGKALKTTTSTLPASSSASKKILLNDLYGGNKYNTITNGSCAYQAANVTNYHHSISNGLARKAVPEEMLSSTSSSTSTLSAMTESSTSSSLLAAKNLAIASKENGQTTIKVVNHLDGGDPVSVSACKTH